MQRVFVWLYFTNIFYEHARRIWHPYFSSATIMVAQMLLSVTLYVSTYLSCSWFQVPPRNRWGLRSFGLLRTEYWQFLTEVSGQHIGPKFNGLIVCPEITTSRSVITPKSAVILSPLFVVRIFLTTKRHKQFNLPHRNYGYCEVCHESWKRFQINFTFSKAVIPGRYELMNNRSSLVHL
jgi:hypothetical protein